MGRPVLSQLWPIVRGLPHLGENSTSPFQPLQALSYTVSKRFFVLKTRVCSSKGVVGLRGMGQLAPDWLRSQAPPEVVGSIPAHCGTIGVVALLGV